MSKQLQLILALAEDRDRYKALAGELAEALLDMRGGWRYIREMHGDLYGVGWDRCEESATAALAKYDCSLKEQQEVRA
jgi:hypothetical protein